MRFDGLAARESGIRCQVDVLCMYVYVSMGFGDFGGDAAVSHPLRERVAS